MGGGRGAMTAYRLLSWFLRLVASVFYRQTQVVGREQVPRENEGPVIFAGNHPNSLHDPLLIIATSGRVVHFAAKDTLFESRFLRFFLRNLGAVPVARRQDHGEQADNQGAFEALFEILAEGRAMGIFPEGLSHDEAQLSRLKTGAARIALGVVARHPDLVVRIVPCGLNYVHPKRFRSRVLVQYGPPLWVDAHRLDAYRKDERAAVRALTEELEQALRALTVNASDWETITVLDGVRRLYQPERVTLEQRAELARRFNAHYPKVKDEPDVRALYRRVAEYLDQLEVLGLGDADLRRPLGPFEILSHVASQLILLFLWLPLALPGMLIYVPLLLSVRLLGPRVSPRRDVIATTKLVLGLLLTLTFMGLVTAATAYFHGPIPAVGAALILFLSFHATLRVLERGLALLRLASRLLRLFTFRREVERLRGVRAELERAVAATVARHRPPDLPPIFPAEPPLLDASDNLE